MARVVVVVAAAAALEGEGRVLRFALMSCVRGRRMDAATGEHARDGTESGFRKSGGGGGNRRSLSIGPK